MPGRLETFRNQTLRLVVHTSVAGTKLRIRVSNTYGDRPLAVGGAHVALRASGADVDPASDRALTFDGKAGATVPRGASAVSDPVSFAVPSLSDLAISIYLPGEAAATTSHLLALQQSYLSPQTGDATSAAKFPVGKTIRSWPFLTGVEVDAPPDGAAVVAFGDSWIDGDGSTPDENHRLTDLLAKRLQKDAAGRRLGVVNEGIVGNRLLQDSPRESEFGEALGASGLHRFDRDVLGQPGVRVVVVRIGGNDLGFPGAITPATRSVSAADLIAGYRALADAAHRHGVRVVALTIAPFGGVTDPPGYASPEKDAVRREFNAWLRSSRDLDAVVDLDPLLRDPGDPARLRPSWDSGDHLHPNDAGYAAAAAAIPLSALGGR
jgi:lysophospholipase L1-like esterase